MQHARRLVALLAAALLSSCAAGGATEGPCTVGSDCVSGVCQDGQCVESASGGSGGQGQGGESVGGSHGEGGSANGGGDSGGGTAGGGACSPNHDGTITRAEVPIQAGLSAKFETATQVTFATSGTMNADGTRDWNMAGMFSGDHLDLIQTIPMSGQWFESDFAGATYAAKLSDSSDLLGVFEVNADALLLRGVVSPSGGAQKTELTYDPPVVTLQFPMSAGTTWATNAAVTGYAEGIYSVYAESYQSTVDASGTLETPFGQFKVLRVQTNLTRTVGALVTVIKSFGWTSECFGTVATVTSQNDETQTEFSNVAELKRLAP